MMMMMIHAIRQALLVLGLGKPPSRVISRPGQLSLAIRPWASKMSTIHL